MPIYQVFVTYNGYDVNGIVVAKDVNRAKRLVINQLNIEMKVTPWNKLDVDYRDDLEPVKKKAQKQKGKFIIFDEGT